MTNVLQKEGARRRISELPHDEQMDYVEEAADAGYLDAEEVQAYHMAHNMRAAAEAKAREEEEKAERRRLKEEQKKAKEEKKALKKAREAELQTSPKKK